jgi:hypothetical protein
MYITDSSEVGWGHPKQSLPIGKIAQPVPSTRRHATVSKAESFFFVLLIWVGSGVSTFKIISTSTRVHVAWCVGIEHSQ